MRRRKPRAAVVNLVEALPSVTEAYRKFVEESGHDSDPKAFAARHSAAKAALSHIEQLMKLSGEGAPEDPNDNALGDARQEMHAEQQENEADEPGESG